MTTPQYTVSNTLPKRGYRGIPMTEVLTIMRHRGVEAILGPNPSSIPGATGTVLGQPSQARRLS